MYATPELFTVPLAVQADTADCVYHRQATTTAPAIERTDEPSMWRRFMAIIRNLVQGSGDSKASWVLEREDVSATRARRLVRAQLQNWQWSGDDDVVELLVTELVTNALRHAQGRPVLTLVRRRNLVRCEVQDDTPGTVRASPGRETDTWGRGLVMVDMLSRAWGTSSRRGGKAVWFELPSASEPPA